MTIILKIHSSIVTGNPGPISKPLDSVYRTNEITARALNSSAGSSSLLNKDDKVC